MASNSQNQIDHIDRKLVRSLIAGTANFIFPGLGYIYLSKRTTFGLILMIANLVLFLAIEEIGAQILNSLLVWLVMLTYSLAFALDAYDQSKEVD